MPQTNENVDQKRPGNYTNFIKYSESPINGPRYSLICRVHHAKCPAGIKIAGRNINNLRYADDTTLVAESEEEVKSLLMRVKEESEKAGLKLNIQKAKIMASSSIISWPEGKKVEAVTDFSFLGLQNHCKWRL